MTRIERVLTNEKVVIHVQSTSVKCMFNVPERIKVSKKVVSCAVTLKDRLFVLHSLGIHSSKCLRELRNRRLEPTFNLTCLAAGSRDT